MTEKIREQIKALRKAGESITSWGGRYGTYAPLEKHLTNSADTMEAMLKVVEAAEHIKFDANESVNSPGKDLLEALANLKGEGE